MTEEKSSPNIDWLKNDVLNHKLKVILTDNREITGTAECIDY